MDRQTRATLQQHQVFTFIYVGRQGLPGMQGPCQRHEHTTAATPGVWECRAYGLGARSLRITYKHLWCNDCVRALIESGCYTEEIASRFMLSGRFKQATLVRAYNEDKCTCVTSDLLPCATDGHVVASWLLDVLAGRESATNLANEIHCRSAQLDRARQAIMLLYEVDSLEVLNAADKASLSEAVCTWARERGIFTQNTLAYIQSEIHRQNDEQQDE